MLVALDQVTKAFVRANLVEGQSVTVIPGIFDLTLVYNRGVAFGLLQGLGVFLTPLAALVAILAGLGFARSASREKTFRFAMILLAAGAIGNLVDRLFLGGKVTDFIDTKIIHVFNVADACITIAALALVLHWILDARENSRTGKVTGG
jgi:signal peptidase II